MALPFNRFLNLVYFWATEDAEDKEKDKFDIRLNMPDARTRAKRPTAAIVQSSPWSKENEESALHGLAAALGGRD
jgi:hypothetical protein